ncbi:MAG: hypothetical protein KGO52_07760 [Nitrospirota bacterium]|nr:hypothetical protein [Nitrospirota bacterium]MDE3242599.1 hypothetical protein [Nitrospirota bacterium]
MSRSRWSPSGGSGGATAPGPAQAASIQVNGQWVNAGGGIRPGVVGSFLTYAMPTESMEEGHWYVKAVPGYFLDSGSNDGQKLSQFDAQGAGMSVRFLRALSDHWGVGLQGVYARTASGNAQQISFGAQGYETQGNSRLSLPLQYSAYSVMAEVVYDPMSGPGFRVPMFLGLSLNALDATTEGTFRFQGNSFYTKNKTQPIPVPGISIGIAPQHSWGPFRFIPFAVGTHDLQKLKRLHRLENVSTGEVVESGGEPHSYSSLHFGITLKYIPWDLSVSYVRAGLYLADHDSPVTSQTELFTLAWAKTF